MATCLVCARLLRRRGLLGGCFAAPSTKTTMHPPRRRGPADAGPDLEQADNVVGSGLSAAPAGQHGRARRGGPSTRLRRKSFAGVAALLIMAGTTALAWHLLFDGDPTVGARHEMAASVASGAGGAASRGSSSNAASTASDARAEASSAGAEPALAVAGSHNAATQAASGSSVMSHSDSSSADREQGDAARASPVPTRTIEELEVPPRECADVAASVWPPPLHLQWQASGAVAVVDAAAVAVVDGGGVEIAAEQGDAATAQGGDSLPHGDAVLRAAVTRWRDELGALSGSRAGLRPVSPGDGDAYLARVEIAIEAGDGPGDATAAEEQAAQWQWIRDLRPGLTAHAGAPRDANGHAVPHGENEAYTLDILPEGATGQDGVVADVTRPKARAVRAVLRARSVFGALHGLRLLRQLASRRQDCAVVLPTSVEARDAPVLAHRGLMLDLARNWYGTGAVLRIIRGAAALRFNAVYLHLTDDSAFGIDSDALPHLPRKGGVGMSDFFRDPEGFSNNEWKGRGDDGAARKDGGREGPLFHTRESLGRIVREGALHGVRVIPEVDVPGHTLSWGLGLGDAAVSQCQKYDAVHIGGNGHTLNPFERIVMPAVGSVVREVAAQFPDPWLHLGGDETGIECWAEDERVVAAARRERSIAEAAAKWVAHAREEQQAGGGVPNVVPITQAPPGVLATLVGQYFERQLHENVVAPLLRGQDGVVGGLGAKTIIRYEEWLTARPAAARTAPLIVESWKLGRGARLHAAVADGIPVLVSFPFYYDTPEQSWQAMLRAPLPPSTIGGIGKAWELSEREFDATVWPRLAVTAARLWSMDNGDGGDAHDAVVEAAVLTAIPHALARLTADHGISGWTHDLRELTLSEAEAEAHYKSIGVAYRARIAAKEAAGELQRQPQMVRVTKADIERMQREEEAREEEQRLAAEAAARGAG